LSDAWHQRATCKKFRSLSNIFWVQLARSFKFEIIWYFFSYFQKYPNTGKAGCKSLAIPAVLRDWNSSPPVPKSLTFSRVSKRKTGKTRSLSSVLGLPNRKAAGCFSSHLNECIEVKKKLNECSGHLIPRSHQELKELLHVMLKMAI